MRRFLIFGFFALCGCISEYVREPKTYVEIAFPENGTYVPDTFKVVVLGLKVGKKKVREEIYGFPDGPVYTTVKPGGCDSFEVLLSVNGKDFKTLKGCDSLMDTVNITGFKDEIRVTATIKGTKFRDEKVYKVKSPYFYGISVLRYDDWYKYKKEYDWGVVGVDSKYENEKWKSYLYLSSNGKKKILDSGYVSLHTTDRYALGIVRVDSNITRIWWIEEKAFKVGEITGDGNYKAVLCDSGVGISAFNYNKFFVFSRLGKVSERVFEGFNGKGCVDGYPYLISVGDGEISLIGKDIKTLKKPSVNFDKYAQFSIYGLKGSFLLTASEYYKQHILFFDGKEWLKSYLPILPTSYECKYEVSGISFIGCLPIPFTSKGDGCSFVYPELEEYRNGFKGMYWSWIIKLQL